MTITAIRKLREKASRSDGADTVNVEYQVNFTGEFDAAAMMLSGGTTVGSVTLPSDGEAHSTATHIAVNQIDVELEANSAPIDGIALYTVTYEGVDNEALEVDVHPTERDPVIQWRGTDEKEVVEKDFDGTLIKNSVGDRYDPLPERPVQGCSECSITFNTEENPATWCTNYSNTVFNASFYGKAAGNVLVGVIEASQQTERFQGENVTFWQVSVPLRFNANGWRLKLIDNGYHYIDSGGKKVKMRDDSGSESPIPLLLNGSGGKLATAGTPVFYPTNGYKVFPESNWSGLLAKLPNPFV